VLDHHHAVAAVDQPVQHADQLLDVGHVQAHRRLVQHVQRVRRLLAAARDVVAHLGQLGHQLDALRLAARQRRRRLPQREVAEAHVLQQLQRVADVGHGGEELHRLVDFHLQHVADALAAPGDGQRLGVEARAVAASHGIFTSGRKLMPMVRMPGLRRSGSGLRRC
jgi:regulator of replication initiation timing